MSIELIPNEKVMDNPEAFFIATNNKRYFEKVLSGVGVVSNGIGMGTMVSSALETAWITTKIGGFVVPFTNIVLFGKTVTKFSVAALLGGLNPVFIPLTIAEIVCVKKVLSKQKAIQDSDMVIFEGMFDVLGQYIFCPLICDKKSEGSQYNWDKLYDVMKGVGYSDFYIKYFIKKYKNKSIEEMETELVGIKNCVSNDKNLLNAVKKYASSKVLKEIRNQIY